MFTWIAIGCLTAACSGLLMLITVQNRRLAELEDWREEIEAGKGEGYVDAGSVHIANEERGHEDWRNQIL